MKSILLACMAFVQSLRQAFESCAVSNTTEDLLVIPECQLTRSAEAALTKYGLVTEGTAVGQVNVCGVAGIPIGNAFIEGSA